MVRSTNTGTLYLNMLVPSTLVVFLKTSSDFNFCGCHHRICLFLLLLSSSSPIFPFSANMTATNLLSLQFKHTLSYISISILFSLIVCMVLLCTLYSLYCVYIILYRICGSGIRIIVFSLCLQYSLLNWDRNGKINFRVFLLRCYCCCRWLVWIVVMCIHIASLLPMLFWNFALTHCYVFSSCHFQCENIIRILLLCVVFHSFGIILITYRTFSISVLHSFYAEFSSSFKFLTIKMHVRNVILHNTYWRFHIKWKKVWFGWNFAHNLSFAQNLHIPNLNSKSTQLRILNPFFSQKS